MAAGLPLFRRFPGLAERLPHHALLSGPTPVGPLALPGVPDLWVKHDEHSTAAYGGNKPRKLEFLIGDARARGSRRLVTSGGIGTNHGLATAVLAREAGLATTLLLVDQPVTEAVRHQLLLLHASGAKLRSGGSVAGAVRQGILELVASRLAGDRPRLVPTGGSSARGNLGFVSAGLEIAEQVRAGELPEPRQVFVPIGTGGTLAGLAVGFALAGLATRVVGVLVTDILPPSPRRLAHMANSTLRHLRRHAPDAPAFRIGTGDFDRVTDQLGEGYGAPSPAGEEAVALAGELGLTLETTYTGKALAALRDAAQRGILDGPTLFWNTFNGVDVAAALAPLPEPSQLPAAFQRFFDGGR
ncbi:MAG: pyridoxal-phosphate dependent enzyme [Deltaproteobacteria bacterium]|nr:pyridoxal-phosphate dependent enzyme [Deltaproteobacteria bacterium]MBW2445050.1 pyridoxal-phosphate dependent enzyme [Deltaproteobacteria bacterium]